MKGVDVGEARLLLAALLERVLAGEEVVLGEGGKPVAKLVRFDAPTAPRRPGALKGRITIGDDFGALPPDLAGAFGSD
ncbi:MAG: type II toxin-antitoxin system prevent-host-death family antitoxin [Acidobacteria bacterium]|nr:MAG: type II toxin-antitoxin system prevent-host-death family antitoxin [Acidobacteriota bacterium]REK09284.1 MAG: type II toxin-antitoxin system prevent-host-death family antitoxin [Acidobacteriota bacterium]